MRRYPSDVPDDEWTSAAPYLALVREDAPQRRHDLRRTSDASCYVVRTGVPWRYLPGDFPPHDAVFQQAQRWSKAGVFDKMAADLRALLRVLAGRGTQPTGAVIDSRSTPSSGHRAGYDGAKRRRGSKVHAAVDTIGHLLALVVTPADVGDRDVVEALCRAVQAATGESVEVA